MDANYGRLDSITYSHPKVSNTNCKAANSLFIVRLKCNEEASCELHADNSVFGDPCLGIHAQVNLGQYLQVLLHAVNWGEKWPFATIQDAFILELHQALDHPSIFSRGRIKKRYAKKQSLIQSVLKYQIFFRINTFTLLSKTWWISIHLFPGFQFHFVLSGARKSKGKLDKVVQNRFYALGKTF